MGKVASSDVQEDCLYRGEWLTVRCMFRGGGGSPALDWFHGLEAKGKGQVIAACQVLETTLRSGRPPAGRAEHIPRSSTGLSELKVTKPGSTPPHLRAFFVRRGQTIWVADGITKQKNTLEPRDWSQAEGIAAAWIEANDRPTPPTKGKGHR
jgi:hypothetical protein